MTNVITRSRSCLILLLLGVACARPAEGSDSAVIRCAAEALYMSRQTGRSPADSDRDRDQAARFRDMLAPRELDEATARIEALADQRGAEPLVTASECKEAASANASQERD